LVTTLAEKLKPISAGPPFSWVVYSVPQNLDELDDETLRNFCEWILLEVEANVRTSQEREYVKNIKYHWLIECSDPNDPLTCMIRAAIKVAHLVPRVSVWLYTEPPEYNHIMLSI